VVGGERQGWPADLDVDEDRERERKQSLGDAAISAAGVRSYSTP
jgi:hypothetical protein